MQMQKEFIKVTQVNKKSKSEGKAVIQKQESSCSVQTKQQGLNQNTKTRERAKIKRMWTRVP